MLSSYLDQLKDLEHKKTGVFVSYNWKSGKSAINDLKVLTDRLEYLENEKRKLESAFYNAIDKSKIGFAKVALDGRFITVNQTWSDAVGRSENELKKLNWRDITVKKYIDTDLENVQRVIDGELPSYTMYKEYFKPDKTIVPLLLTVTCVFDRSDNLLYFISQAVFTDYVDKLLYDKGGKGE